MSTLCPTGGSYWDPRCCWWLTNSWVCTAIVRIYDVVRVALWLLARLLDFLGTLLFNVLIPFLTLVFVSAAAFINFMIGLLFGEFRLEFSILVPLFLFIGSWLLWLFWPGISCFIPTLWSLVYDFLQTWSEIVVIFPTLINLVIRIWNSLVPVIGFIIYIIIEIVVITVILIVELLGSFDVIALLASLLQIFVIVVELGLNIIIAIVGVLTTDLSAFTDAIGPTLAVIITAAKVLIAVTVWVFGALWALLEPILVTLIAVFKFIKSHFLLRQLLSIDELDTAEDAMPSDRLWRTLGMASQRYWTEADAASGINALGAVNKWQTERSPGAAVDYYWYQRAAYASFDSGATDRPPGRSLFSVPASVPPAWARPNATAPPSAGSRRHLHDHEHLSAMAARMLAHRSAPPLPADWVPLHEEVDTHHVECQSHLCGGHGRRLRHPTRVAIDERPPWLYDALGAGHDHHTHRRRFTHTVALAHVVRKTAAHVAHKHWARGTGELPRRVTRAWHEITGHHSLQQTIDHYTARHEHPFDAVASLVPTPSDWAPVRLLRRLGGDDGSDGVYHADWLAQRHVFYRDDTADEHGRRRLHVSLDPLAQPQPEEHVRERRGKFDPDTPNNARDPIRQKGGGNADIPSLPVFQLLYTQDCNSKPKNQLCIPEISPQIGCVLASIMQLFPKKPPVEFCGYEEECADVGFCIIERPPIGPDIFVVLNNTELWLSWCWLQNGLVWIGVVLSIILPVIRLTFQVLAALLPFLSWFFNAFVDIIPELVSVQELVCLIPFFYGFVLWVVLLYVVYIFVLPLLFWFWRTIISFDAMFSAIRSIEATRLAYLEQGGSRQLIENFWRVNHAGVLPGDAWMNSPLITRPPNPAAGADPFADARAQAGRVRVFAPPQGGSFMPYIPLTTGYVPDEDDLARVSPLLRPDLEARTMSNYSHVPLVAPIGADVEAAACARAAADEPVSGEARAAIGVYMASLRHANELFGAPRGIVTFDDVYNHEARFRLIIHPAEWSGAWLRRYMAEHAHQATANTTRRPPSLVYQRGMFDELF